MSTRLPFVELRVVTTASWVARDLARGTDLPVVHDVGLDVPADTGGTAWWAPHRFVARLAATPGVNQPCLASPGPGWVTTVDPKWLGRRVWAGQLSDVGDCDLWSLGAVFAKAAEIKLGELPAATYRTPGSFTADAQGAGLTPESWVVLSEVVEFTEEYRCFIAPGVNPDGPRVVASCLYLASGVTWDFWGSAADAPDSSIAALFAARVAASTPGPAGYVLDVGRLVDGSWAVVEANAAWSSNPYHCDPTGVVAAVLAAQDPAADRTWAWRPDPRMGRFARPLPVRST